MHTIIYGALIVYKRGFLVCIIFTMYSFGYGDLNTSVKCKDVSYYVQDKDTRIPFVILHYLFDMYIYLLF